MKAIFAALFALTLSAGVAHAGDVQIPSEVGESASLVDYLSDLRAVQAAEITLLTTQMKYYEILKLSFEGSHAVSTAFDEEQLKNTGVRAAKGTVQLVVDGYLAKMWLKGATPSALVIKDIWAASRGQTGRMTSVGKKTFGSLMELGRTLKIPKKFVSTAAFGVFAYIQYENFWVINMSEAQYQAVISSLDVKIATVVARRIAIADSTAKEYAPISAK